MPLSENQKKYIVLGTVGGAFALFVGSLMFGDRKASATPMLGPPGARAAAPGRQDAQPRHHDKHRTRRRHDDEGDGRERDRENDRGEYGGKKKHHHKGHRHGH